MAKNFVEQLTIKAVAEGFEKINQQIESLQKPLDKFGKRLESVGKDLSLKLTAPLALFAGFAISEFGKAEKAIAKVQTQLKLTGTSIGITFQELQDASENLQKNSIFGDDDILEKVSGQLLRVSGLTKDSFQQAQQVVVDLASALDTDLSSAALQVAKALESPVEGLSALSRVGVKFTDDQEKLIKNLVATGRQAEAQGFILDILRGKFDGVAKAVSQTSFGALAQLKNAFDNLAEAIGGRLFAIIEPFVKKLTTMLENLKNLNPEILDFGIKIGALLAVLGPVSLGLGLLAANFSLLVSPMTLALPLLVGITSVLDFLAGKFKVVNSIISLTQGLMFGIATIVVTLGTAFTLLVSEVNELTGVFGKDNQRNIDEFGKKLAELGLSLQDFSAEKFKGFLTGEGGDVFSVNDLFGDIQKFIADVKKLGEESGKEFKDGVRKGFGSGVDLYDNRAALDARDEMDQKIADVEKKSRELTEAGQIFSNSFTTAFSNIASGADGLGQSFKKLGQNIVNSLFNAAIQNAFTKLFQNLGGIFTQGGVLTGAPNITGATQAADGGLITGPGTSRSDSIPAWLSNGEYVINAKSAGILGLNLLNKLNSLGKGFNPKSRLGLPAFADGGSVAGGSGVSVNVINNSSQPVNARASTRFDGRQLIIDTFLEDARNNGPMSQNIQNLYGVRR